MPKREPIRLCEWGSVDVELNRGQRLLIAAAADKWRETNHLPACPLEFGGPEGARLSARQYVGVVEVEDVAIEIYPKLDRSLMDKDQVDEHDVGTVMQNLLWILEVSGQNQPLHSDIAHLEESSLSYVDLFAYLMARDLLTQLEAGLAHAYVRRDEDITWVRGRIRLEDQIARNWMRPDRIACSWDEFTPNTPLNRLFRCACRLLIQRVRHPFVSALLQDCAWMLEDVDDTDPVDALREAKDIRWDRGSERFRQSFIVARQLLAGMGYDLASGLSQTFVFLLDMNLVFEQFALRVIECAARVPVRYQYSIGTLVKAPRKNIQQIPDFCWNGTDIHWIADAKYKFLAGGEPDRLMANDENGAESEGKTNVYVLSPDDLRQLTVYAELAKRRFGTGSKVDLVVLYPYTEQTEFLVDSSSFAELWNGSPLYLVPVKLTRCLDSDLRLALPTDLPPAFDGAADLQVAFCPKMTW